MGNIDNNTSESIKIDKAKRTLGGKFASQSGDGESIIQNLEDSNVWGDIPDNKFLLVSARESSYDGGTAGSNIVFGSTAFNDDGSRRISDGVSVYAAYTVEDRQFFMVPFNWADKPVGNSEIWIGYDPSIPPASEEIPPESFEQGYFWIQNLEMNGDFIPGTDSTHDLGLSGNRWANGYFDDLFYSGTLSNSHQIEDPKKMPVEGKHKQGTVLVLSEEGVVPSYKANDRRVVGVYETKHKAVATFGVYKVQLKGKAKKGDALVSTRDGRARKAWFWERNYIGLAMEEGENEKISFYIKS